MEINEWAQKVKGCSPTVCTGGMDIRCSVDREKNIWYLRHTPRVRGVHKQLWKEYTVKVAFREPVEHLSIFQAEVLVLLFLSKKKPMDYAQYHKCTAGAKFIYNIKYVEVY